MTIWCGAGMLFVAAAACVVATAAATTLNWCTLAHGASLTVRVRQQSAAGESISGVFCSCRRLQGCMLCGLWSMAHGWWYVCVSLLCREVKLGLGACGAVPQTFNLTFQSNSSWMLVLNTYHLGRIKLKPESMAHAPHMTQL